MNKIIIFILSMGVGFLSAQQATANAIEESEIVFNWAEHDFAQFFPESVATQFIEGWRYRYYPSTDTYLGINDQDQSIYLLGGAFGPTATKVDQVKPLLNLALKGSGNASDIGTSQQGLSAYKNRIWQTNQIPVCFEETLLTSGFNTEKSWVRQAIAETWAKESTLTFTGWSSCQADSKGIIIGINDVRPSSNIGQRDGIARMVMNFEFKEWQKDCASNAPVFINGPHIPATTQREFCVKVIAVHEFGHALGFAHENTRTDGPFCDKTEEGDYAGNYLITPYDLYSIMNYCNPNWNGNGLLSTQDINGLVAVYGRNSNSSANLKSEVTGLSSVPGGTSVFTVGEEGNIWSAFYDPRISNPQWSSIFRLSPTNLTQDDRVAAVSATLGGTTLFVVGKDQQVWSAYYDPRVQNPQWTSWFPLGGKVRPGSHVTAISSVEGGVSLFVVGTDNAIWSAYFDPRVANPKWTEWFPLGGTARNGSDVTAVSSLNGGIDLFTVGTDNAVWSAYFDPRAGNPKWTDWFSLGGEVRVNGNVNPVVTVKSQGGIAFFVVGSDNAVWMRQTDPKDADAVVITKAQSKRLPTPRVLNAKWTAWRSLGGEVRQGSDVTPLSSFERSISLFVVGTNNAVWSAYYDSRIANSDWTSWFSLGGAVADGTSVSAVTATEGGSTLFVKGTEGYIWSAFYDPRVAKPAWSTWFALGR